jgi:hypothetical protein
LRSQRHRPILSKSSLNPDDGRASPHALRVTELLGFDLMFLEVLLGSCSESELVNFVDACVRPGFNLASGDPRETDALGEHIRFLQSQIQSSLATLSKCDPGRLDLSRRPPDLI